MTTLHQTSFVRVALYFCSPVNCTLQWQHLSE